MNAFFLDSVYLLALELASDQNHALALQHWEQIRQQIRSLVTSSYVFDETVTYLNSRGYHNRAVRVGNNLLHSDIVKVVQVDNELFEAAWAYFQARPDKRYSLTDCISFIIMQDRRIDTALTFDKHFLQAGFQKLP